MKVTRWTRAAARLSRANAYLAVAGTSVAGAAFAALGSNAACIAICTAFPAWLVMRYFVARELARLPAYQAAAHAEGDADALAEVRRLWTNLGAEGARAEALSNALLGEELALREKDFARVPLP